MSFRETGRVSSIRRFPRRIDRLVVRGVDQVPRRIVVVGCRRLEEAPLNAGEAKGLGVSRLACALADRPARLDRWVAGHGPVMRK